MQQFDIVIIGSGLGGLTAGATLAKKGKKVLVLEQHYLAGGCATTFERNGVKYEVGLHEMDWGTPYCDMKGIIFKKLGLFKRIELIDLPELWKVRFNDKDYLVPEGREEAIAYFSKEFPEDAKGIRKYFNEMKKTVIGNRALPSDLKPWQFFMYPLLVLPGHLKEALLKRTAADVMNKYIKSDVLKVLLNINMAYYIDRADAFPWDHHAAAQYSYYNSGKFVKGGSQELSNALVDIITENGGEVRLMADVQQIIVENDTAKGVVYFDRRTKENITVHGKKVIANCGPVPIYDGKMVPEKYSEPRVTGKRLGTSLFSVYLTMKEAPAKRYPGMAYSTFLVGENVGDTDFRTFNSKYPLAPINKRGFVYVDYSTIDSGLVKEGDPRAYGTFCTYSHIEEWEYLSAEEYKAKKDEVAKEMFAKMEEKYPGFTDLIEHYEVGTPKTIQRFTKTPNGTPYGFYPQLGVSTMKRGPMTASQIKNLYYTGVWTFPANGFTGAIISGYATATHILFPMQWRVILGTIACIIFGNTVIPEVIHRLVQFFGRM